MVSVTTYVVAWFAGQFVTVAAQLVIVRNVVVVYVSVIVAGYEDVLTATPPRDVVVGNGELVTIELLG